MINEMVTRIGSWNDNILPCTEIRTDFKKKNWSLPVINKCPCAQNSWLSASIGACLERVGRKYTLAMYRHIAQLFDLALQPDSISTIQTYLDLMSWIDWKSYIWLNDNAEHSNWIWIIFASKSFLIQIIKSYLFLFPKLFLWSKHKSSECLPVYIYIHKIRVHMYVLKHWWVFEL